MTIMSTENNVVPEKLLERVRKLYAMSEQSVSSPHEAEIAMRRCQSLMSKYGINEADLEVSEFGISSVRGIKTQVPSYVLLLAKAVGLLHDCIVVRNREVVALEFRGYGIDADVSLLTLEYLQETLKRLLRIGKNNGSVAGGRSPSHDFRVGFSFEIYRRCKEIDQQRKADDKSAEAVMPGTSLVVKKLAMVRENCCKDVIFKKSKVKVAYRDSDAGSAGTAAGAAVSLSPQVNHAVCKQLN